MSEIMDLFMDVFMFCDKIRECSDAARVTVDRDRNLTVEKRTDKDIQKG